MAAFATVTVDGQLRTYSGFGAGILAAPNNDPLLSTTFEPDRAVIFQVFQGQAPSPFATAFQVNADSNAAQPAAAATAAAVAAATAGSGGGSGGGGGGGGGGDNGAQAESNAIAAATALAGAVASADIGAANSALSIATIFAETVAAQASININQPPAAAVPSSSAASSTSTASSTSFSSASSRSSSTSTLPSNPETATTSTSNATDLPSQTDTSLGASNDSNVLSAGAKAGIAVGVLAIVVILAVSGLWLWLTHRRRKIDAAVYEKASSTRPELVGDARWPEMEGSLRTQPAPLVEASFGRRDLDRPSPHSAPRRFEKPAEVPIYEKG